MRSLDEIWCELEKIKQTISAEHCDHNGCDECPFDDGHSCVINRMVDLQKNLNEVEGAVAQLMVGTHEK